jgi:TPR repeat protein
MGSGVLRAVASLIAVLVVSMLTVLYLGGRFSDRAIVKSRKRDPENRRGFGPAKSPEFALFSEQYQERIRQKRQRQTEEARAKRRRRAATKKKPRPMATSTGEETRKTASTVFELPDNRCLDGDVHACYEAGQMYLKGKGVLRDLDKAQLFFSQGCMTRNARACSALIDIGSMYEKGIEVSRDEDEARQIYIGVCDMGSAKGCQAAFAFYRTRYRRGEDVKNNVDEAHYLLTNSCRGPSDKCRDIKKTFLKDLKEGIPEVSAIAAARMRAELKQEDRGTSRDGTR